MITLHVAILQRFYSMIYILTHVREREEKKKCQLQVSHNDATQILNIESEARERNRERWRGSTIA